MNMEQRRKVRTLEAKRDALMAQKAKAIEQLKVVRVQLKHERSK